MPSLHAADALIVGFFLVSDVAGTSGRRRSGRSGPLWVWFCVIATANHYVLDVLAGIVVAVVVAARHRRGRRGSSDACARLGPAIANLL